MGSFIVTTLYLHRLTIESTCNYQKRNGKNNTNSYNRGISIFFPRRSGRVCAIVFRNLPQQRLCWIISGIMDRWMCVLSYYIWSTTNNNIYTKDDECLSNEHKKPHQIEGRRRRRRDLQIKWHKQKPLHDAVRHACCYEIAK